MLTKEHLENLRAFVVHANAEDTLVEIVDDYGDPLAEYTTEDAGSADFLANLINNYQTVYGELVRLHRSIAEEIADYFLGDGQCFERDGNSFDDVCEGRASKTVTRGDDTKWIFPDGSAIVWAKRAWGIGLTADDDCFCWAAEDTRNMDNNGHNNGCPREPGRVSMS